MSDLPVRDQEDHTQVFHLVMNNFNTLHDFLLDLFVYIHIVYVIHYFEFIPKQAQTKTLQVQESTTLILHFWTNDCQIFLCPVFSPVSASPVYSDSFQNAVNVQLPQTEHIQRDILENPENISRQRPNI